MSYTNADGLFVRTHGEQGTAENHGVSAVFGKRHFIYEIKDATTIPASPASPEGDDQSIPAGSYITGAWLVVETAFTSSGAATLTLGLQEADGTAIDADGLDATIALAALGADKAVALDGALVGGTATVGADPAFISINYGTAAYTAGKAKVVIEYISP